MPQAAHFAVRIERNSTRYFVEKAKREIWRGVDAGSQVNNQRHRCRPCDGTLRLGPRRKARLPSQSLSPVLLLGNDAPVSRVVHAVGRNSPDEFLGGLNRELTSGSDLRQGHLGGEGRQCETSRK